MPPYGGDTDGICTGSTKAVLYQSVIPSVPVSEARVSDPAAQNLCWWCQSTLAVQTHRKEAHECIWKAFTHGLVCAHTLTHV